MSDPSGGEVVAFGRGRISSPTIAYDEVVLAPAEVTPSPDRLPSRIGRYVVLEVVGVGGMGVVATAYDPKLDRKIALKLVRQREHDDARRVSIGQQRLQREARALAKLKHPNVVAVHDVDVVDGRLYIAMEFVEGESVADWMEREPRPWRQVVDVFIQAARGLQAAHAAGIVHRDFKPANVLLEPGGRVVVLDFGLALAQQEINNSAEDSAEIDAPYPDEQTHTAREDRGPDTYRRLTAVGRRVGTPAYMSPEQILGRSVAAATDQFAFGVSMYEALYGALPFQGSAQDAMWNAIEGIIAPPPKSRSVPPWLHRIVVRTLSREPATRFPDMAAVIAEIERGLARRRQVRVATVAGATLAVVGIAGVAWSSRNVCPGAAERVDGLWNEARKQTLRDDFMATATPFAVDAAHGSIAAVDATAEAWKSAHVEICEATRVRGEQSDVLLDHRMACLDGALLELNALLELFEGADADLVEHAVDAAQGLADPQACGEARLEDGDARVPPEERPQVEAARGYVARALVLLDAGRGAEALVAARAASDLAEGLSNATLRVEARRILAEGLRAAGDYDAAHAEFEAGIRDAARHRLLIKEAELWITRLHMHAVDPRQFDVALNEAFATEAAVERAGSPPLYVAQLEQSMGAAWLGKGDLARATDHLLRALEGFERLEDPVSLARARNDLGAALSRSGDHTRAAAAYRAAYDAYLERVGPSHPATATFAFNLGTALMQTGEAAHHDEAEALFQRARSVREAVFGMADEEVAEVLLSEGALAKRRGDHDRAIQTLQRAIEIFGGSNSKDLRAGMAYNTIAGVELARQRLDSAEDAFTSALGVFERGGALHHPSRLRAIVRRGQTRLDSGDVDGARADHQVALELRPSVQGLRADDDAELATLGAGVAR